jgi:Fe-S-cluster containining protein
MTDPAQLKQKARLAEPATKKIFTKLKKNKTAGLDNHFHTLHYQAFEKIDCLNCANCCKTTSPIFYQKDIENAAVHLRLKPSAFIEKYLRLDEENDYVLKQTPCPFLNSDNYCGIYASRPTACKEYPHTNRKKMYQLLDLTMRNTHVCPAVFEIVEQIKKKYPA